MDTLPVNPTYCFAPVEDAEAEVKLIRILIEGMDVAVGTSLVTLTVDECLSIADNLNRAMAWTRET